MHRRAADWFNRHKYRIGLVAVGHTAKKIEEFVFDWLIYGAVVTTTAAYYGPIWGAVVAFLIMTPVTGLACYAYLVFYDWLKKDWLGLETIEELRQSEENAGWIMKHIIRIAKWGDIPMFLVLSVHTDAFMTTVYFRRGAHQYNGLSRKDWAIFWTSLIVSNMYWTLRMSVLLQIILYVWHRFIQPFVA